MTRSNRRRLLKQGSLAATFAGVASMLGLTPFSPAEAATASSQNTPQITALTGSKAEGYIHQVLTSPNYQQFQRHVQRDYAGTLTIRQQASIVQNVTDNQNSWIQVHIPIAGGEGHSHYVAFFQKGSSTISQAFGSLFTFTPEQNIAAVMEKNGALVADVTVTPDGQAMQGIIYRPDGTKVILDGSNLIPDDFACWWNCTAACLGNLGLPLALIALIGIICGFSCTNPETGIGIAICVTCMIGAVGVLSGIIVYCADVCIC